MKTREWFERIVEKVRTNKKLQFLLIGLLLAIILLVYGAYFIQGTNEGGAEEKSNVYESSTEEYVASLEEKLSKVLSDIEGAGKVSVAITVSSGFVYEYAYEEVSKDSLSSTSTSSSLIMVDDSPIIVSKTYPVISGVLVVAEGGQDIRVKLNILESIQTLLEVSNDDITILSGEF